MLTLKLITKLPSTMEKGHNTFFHFSEKIAYFE